MAASHDPELKLDREGNLVSLYKRGDEKNGSLLTPEQVATCVKFVYLTPAVAKNTLPMVVPSPYKGDVTGLKVNVIGGPSGAGKTSLIRIMAGGMETGSQASSDTICPTVYLFKYHGDAEGETFALLDTAGLCDTATTALLDKAGGTVETVEKPMRGLEMQELLINAVAATLQMYKLRLVSFLMCVDVSGRLPGNFSSIWPQMQFGLGGDLLDPFCRFVITKMNAEGRTEKIKLQELPETNLYKALEGCGLGWKVVSAGRENLEELEKDLAPISTKISGIGGEQVDPEAKSLATKREILYALQAKVQRAKDMSAATGDDKVIAVRNLDTLERGLDEAEEHLNSVWCFFFREKARVKAMMQAKKLEIVQARAALGDGEMTLANFKVEIERITAELEKELDEIAKMLGWGKWARSIATGVVRGAVQSREHMGGASSA